MTSNDVSMDELHALSQSKWLKRHYQAWLQMRGLKSEGTVLELKQWVMDFQTSPGGSPPIIPNAGRKSKNLLLTTQALTGMISHIMILDVNEQTILEVDHRIKLFLSYFHCFDQEIIGNILKIYEK